MSNIPLSSVHQAGGSIGASGNTPDVMTAATTHDVTSPHPVDSNSKLKAIEKTKGIPSKKGVIEKNDMSKPSSVTRIQEPPTTAKKDTKPGLLSKASKTPPDMMVQSEGKIAATRTSSDTPSLEVKVGEISVIMLLIYILLMHKDA